jgi:hypothetical protein
MKNLDNISEDLFNKIRGKFSNVTIGDEKGNVTTEPSLARFYDFDFKAEGRDLGKVSVSVSEDEGVVVMYSNELVTDEDKVIKDQWYSFLKELRGFAKKRLLNFNTRNITKSNLNKRDYKFLATNRSGEDKMNESKLYGTSRVSYQDFDNARLVIKHTESVNAEIPTGRTQKVGSIFIDNFEGERFKYPYKHISGARAMARHVAEGGNPHDDFGKHIVGLSEEMAKLRKFKNYMGRSAVMAESLSEYIDVVKERVATVKKTIESLQKKSFYAEALSSFEVPVLEDVPTDVAENWIDELTIRQFNEELKDVFPYIYKLVSEATKARELGPLDLEGYTVYEGEDQKCSCCGDTPCSCDESCEECGGKGQYDESGLQRYTGIKKYGKEEMEIESAFEEMMGQFTETDVEGEDESFDPQSEPSKQDAMADEFMDAYEKGGEPALAKAMGMTDQELDQEITEYGMEHGLHADDDRDDIIQGVIEQMIDNMDEGNAYEEGADPLDAICNAHGGEQAIKQSIEDGSFYDNTPLIDALQSHYGIDDRGMSSSGVADEIIDRLQDDLNFDEGNAYANAIRQAKKDGKKKGDKIQGPDDDEITLEKDKKTPLGEFILSHFDKETGEFPKGETAVLTMVEKDYGNKFIEPAKQFIEKVYQTCEAFEVAANPQQIEADSDFDRMRELAGLR